MAGNSGDGGKLYVLSSKGEPLTAGTPKELEAYARAVVNNKTPLHMVCDGKSITVGSLVYTSALGTRLLGRRYAVFTVHACREISEEAVRESLFRHFSAITGLDVKARGMEFNGKGRGVDFEGAHLISFKCTPDDTLVLGLGKSAPRGAIPVGEFVSYLSTARKMRPKADDAEGRRAEALELFRYHAAGIDDYPWIIMRQLTEKPGELAEMAEVNRCALFLRPVRCGTQVEKERKGKARV